MCGENAGNSQTGSRLLRALSGALMAIAAAVFVIAATAGTRVQPVILLLVLPADGINAICMYRVGSPFYIPFVFVLFTLAGVGLAWIKATP